MPWINVENSKTIPASLQLGSKLKIANPRLTEQYTQPPEYLSESDLIGLMEKNCIGTDASMAVHINNICEREYVKVVGKDRRLEPTKIGLALAHGY